MIIGEAMYSLMMRPDDLVEKPEDFYNSAVAFGHYGKAIYEIFKFIGVDVEEIGFNQPAGMLYKTENPFA